MVLAASGLVTIDFVVIGAYLLITIALGVWLGRRLKTGADFFLAGRTLPWWAIGMSLVATDIGGTDIIGVGGAAYSYGLAVANFEWIGCVPAMIVAAFVFIPFFYRTGVYTVPEFMERRYNAGVRGVLAFCWLAFMACNLGIMLLASGKMMATLFGWDTTWCILLTAGLVGFYTCVGGLAAVVYTDSLQCAVMIGGCLLVLVLGVIRVGGLGELQQRVRVAEQRRLSAIQSETISADALERRPSLDDKRPDHARLILPADSPSPFPWPAIYFGLALILSPAYWIGNQAIIQRSLGAKSEFHAKASYVWGALLKNVIPLIIAVPGLVALALFPDLEDGDRAFPQLVQTLLPVGLRGLFVAAFLAALMSTIDSYLNSAATIVCHDVYTRFVNPRVSGARLLVIGRIVTIAFVVWAIAFALGMVRASERSGVYAIFQTLMSFFQGPALAVLLGGILWRRATGKAAFAALLGGIMTAVGMYTVNQPTVYQWLGWQPLFKIQEPFLYYSIWAFLTTVALLLILSLLTKPDPDEKTALALGARFFKGFT